MTKLRIESRAWTPGEWPEATEENPKPSPTVWPNWYMQISIDGPGGSFSGPQWVDGLVCGENATDAEFAAYIKAAWGGKADDDWEIGT